jgi:hypothetical protein
MARHRVVFAGPLAGSELVALSPVDHAECMAVAARWHQVGIDRRLPARHGISAAMALDADQLGACGECCVARALGVAWRPKFEPDRGTPDVGIYHVRTAHQPGYRLPIHDDDADAGLFVLVVVHRPPRVFRIVGTIRGLAGKRVAYAGDPTRTGRPAYWVPQSALDPWADRPFA